MRGYQEQAEFAANVHRARLGERFKITNLAALRNIGAASATQLRWISAQHGSAAGLVLALESLAGAP